MTAVGTVTQNQETVYWDVLTLDRLQKTAVDRLQNTAVDTVTQNQQVVKCEDLTDSADALEDNSVHSDAEQQTVQYEILTQWTYCRRQQRTL